MSNFKFTMVAGQAMNFATLFNAAFARGLDGPVPHRIELMLPAGPSTAGGKQAKQHIRLVPANGGAAIVMGSLDTTRRAVEIRTFKHVAELHARRFKGAPIPIAEERYIALVRQMQNFFASQNFMVTLVDVSSSIPPPGDEPKRSAAAYIVVAVVFVVLALGVAAALFLHARHMF